MRHWTDLLARVGACVEAVTWASAYDSLAEAWSACQRGDWMLWLAGTRAGKPGSEARRRLVPAVCECARLALPYVLAGEDRPRLAIDAAEAWARGEASIVDVRTAADAANAANAAAAYTANAAAAAAYTANAAAANAAAAYTANAAANAAANAYTADAANADRRYLATLATCADIVRRHYPEPPELPWEAQKE